jgi:hypothetical protein
MHSRVSVHAANTSRRVNDVMNKRYNARMWIKNNANNSVRPKYAKIISLNSDAISMKQIFLITFIAISGLASGQPYKSIFGSTSTMWIIKWYNLDFGGIDTIVVEKDTLAYGFNWKKIITTDPYSFFGPEGLLREDTLIGKVWYHPLESGIDSTYLAFDYSLQTGDTFDLSSNYDPYLTNVIVDSTSNTDSTKKIFFKAFIEESENITFIEGVGGNQGPIYKESSGLLHPYLLCSYKDGIQTYANFSYEGNCNPPTGIHEAEIVNEIVIHPNPVDGTLYIKNISETDFKKIEVYDAFGRCLYSGIYQSSLKFQDLPIGLYYLRLISNSGHRVTKSVIRK